MIKQNFLSVAAKESLGTALYSSGYFEKALIQFHIMNRKRLVYCLLENIKNKTKRIIDTILPYNAW